MVFTRGRIYIILEISFNIINVLDLAFLHMTMVQSILVGIVVKKSEIANQYLFLVLNFSLTYWCHFGDPLLCLLLDCSSAHRGLIELPFCATIQLEIL